MRGLIIQAGVLLSAVGVIIITTYLVTKSSGPEQFESHLKFGAFSDIHSEPYYDPTVSNEKYCRSNFRGPPNDTF